MSGSRHGPVDGAVVPVAADLQLGQSRLMKIKPAGPEAA